jgi:hypothetical protein
MTAYRDLVAGLEEQRFANHLGPRDEVDRVGDAIEEIVLRADR